MSLCESPWPLGTPCGQSALNHLPRDAEKEGKASQALGNLQLGNGLFCFLWPISDDIFSAHM